MRSRPRRSQAACITRLPLHLQPALARLGHTEGDFPATEEWARTLLSLPMFAELEPAEVERIAAVVTRVGARPA